MVYAPKKNVLAIDQEQAEKQLVLLGYKSGDNVYLTAFFPKGDPRNKGENRDKGRKAERLHYSEVETWQAEGRGVYLVVNGYGHGKDDVKNCRAIFYEHDDLDKDIQLTLWQSLGLPEPTVQVDTGGKSIHSYWVFDQPIHPELWAFDEGKGNWKGLQADLLKFANADKSLVNPNRVMRLAGCWYMVNDDSGTHAVAQSRIVGGCGQKYSYKELRGIIPRSEPPEVKQEKRSHPNVSQETGEGWLDFRTVGHLLPEWNERGRKGWATFQCPVHTTNGKHSDDHIHVNLTDGVWTAHCGCDRKLIYQAVCEIAGHKQKPTGRGYSGRIGGGNRRNFGGGSGGSGGDGGDGGGSDRSEEGFTEQNFWNAPVSWRGEIGWLFEKEEPVTEQDEEGNETPVVGEDGQPVTEKVSTFVPKANFDFVVERELESEEGGGVVLLVKRSLDRVQKRVIISSQDYGSVKDFETALKRVYKSGVVCNLKSEHLKSLIHVKLREYRARGGITYRLQDRAGQQVDGHWVFKDCQITKDGVWSAEPNSDWIFNENLGGEDKMPQPCVVPPNPNALKRLVAAMRKFHGAEGIFPAMMALGFGSASVHYQHVMKIERRFPQVNFIGDPGTNKTVCAANGLSLVGWLNGDGLISGVSESKLYECLKLTGSLPLCLDDPPKSRELDEILKRLYNAIPRMVRGNYQEPHSPLMVTSNHAIGDQQLATLTRMLQIPVYRQTDGDPSAWDEMQEAMKGASGCLPDLIKLGYPKAEIKQLEGELRSHLPKSHPRIASSMALILWYAMAVAKLADFDAESIKQYAITQLCPSANAADTNSDSITDFLDKLSALKSEALVGEWNCQVVETKTEKALAIQMSQVFPMIDRQFNPVYSRKALEALIAKSGGTLQSVQKFHSNRDESLAYRRALLTAEVEPKEPEYKPKRCVLVPFHLIKGFTDDWKSPTPPDDPIEEPVTSPVTSVTPSYTQLHEKCNQQTVDTEQDLAVPDSLVTSFLERSIKEKQEAVESISSTPITNALDEKQKSHTLISEKYVTEENLEAVALILTESRRLHISCNQAVTGCNQEEKNVTEPVEPTVDTITTTADVQPESIAVPTPCENAVEATEAVPDEQTQTPQSTGLPLYQRSDGGFELQSSPVITAAACTITAQDTIDALASAETLAELEAVGDDQIAAVWGQLTPSTKIKILQLSGQLAEGRECEVLNPSLKQQWVDARIVKVILGSGWKVLYGDSKEFAVWDINSIRPKSDS